MPLSKYRRNRRSGLQSGPSPEPRGRLARRRRATASASGFVIQHHTADSDHYDFRLEINGVIASWAIPKGPSTNPKHKRMARRTEDYPLDYAAFEGVIPEGQHGAGTAIVSDRGTYTNATHHDMAACLDRGHLSFRLQGEKLQGSFTLTRIREGKDETWLLIKRQDEEADTRRNRVNGQPAPVVSGRTLDDLAESS
jgi:DNA ligase D-like protein (predicted 3'-phosphoesterase)